MSGRQHFALPFHTRSDNGPLYDAIELAPIAVINPAGDCEPFENLADVPIELSASVFWSIFGHTLGEGVQCLGDFTSEHEALEVLRRLLGDLRPY